MKIEIKSRLNESIIFEGDFSCIAEAVKSAIKNSANLRYANLCYADLRYTNLSHADLSYANLSHANLGFTNLSHANLSYGRITTNGRPFIQISPLGEDKRQLMAFNTNKGICLTTGCFTGSISEFKTALKAKHGTNLIAKEYLLAVDLIENHFNLWK